MRSRNAKIGFCDCWILPEWCQDTFIHDSFWNWLFLFYNIHKLHVNHFVEEEIKWSSLFSVKKITFDRKVFECVWSWIQSEGGLCRKLEACSYHRNYVSAIPRLCIHFVLSTPVYNTLIKESSTKMEWCLNLLDDKEKLRKSINDIV